MKHDTISVYVGNQRESMAEELPFHLTDSLSCSTGPAGSYGATNEERSAARHLQYWTV